MRTQVEVDPAIGLHGFEGVQSLAAAEPFGQCGGCTPGTERAIGGRIDGSGTARALFIGYACPYDLIWQKEPK
jgi:hypothetical protein